jgi:hypothetical protein
VNQTAITFILEEEPGCEEKIENMTTASGCILINNESKAYSYQNASQNTFPVVRVNKSDSNLTRILNELNNETDFLVDNVYNNETLVFTYNFSDNPLGPSDNWVGLVSRTAPSDPESYDPLFGTSGAYYDFGRLWIHQAAWRILNLEPNPVFKPCEGFILYDFQDSDMHFMTHAVSGWDWFMDDPDTLLSESGFSNRWFFPTFSINHSVGEWINDHHDTTTLSGFIDQNFKKQTLTEPGVYSYNTVGYRNISQSPGDGIVVLSNRIDGWWGETPGDSGAGCALLLGIAKYFHEYDITPKYNLTFLFTTGEEYGMRGAQHYSDSHPDEEYNFTRFIGFDQLCFDYTLAEYSLNTSIGVQNEDDIKIISAIADDTDYVGRTGYGLDISIPDSYGSEDYIWKDRCPTVGFGKDNDSSWDGYHRSGMNYIEGDSLKHTDRNDLNVTFELAWEIIKYFTVDPDCWFDSISYESYDSTRGLMKDSIRTIFTVKSILPHDLARVNVSLVESSTQETVDWSIIDYSINSTGADNEVSFTMPEGISDGDYNLTFKLYNSSGRINEIVGIGDNNINQTVTSPGFRLHRYPSLGSNRVGTLTNSVQDIITGSYFKMKGQGEAENITAYIYGKGIYPADPTYKCMIYRLNDSSLVGATEELKPGSIGWKTFSFSEPKPILKDNVDYVLTVWGDNTTELYYHNTIELIGKKDFETYGTPPNPAYFILTQSREWSVFCAFTPETELPEITNVTAFPNTEGFGQDITINADVKDNLTGIDLVIVNISYPDDSTGNFTMLNTENDTYQYTFSDTWFVGQYNYTIWAKDNSSNLNSSSGHSFNVSAQATISIATLKDTYGASEDINITDPPPEDPPIDGGPFDIVWEPSEGSFGPVIKEVNWTYFWNLFNTHSTWKLEGYNPVLDEWVDTSDYLDIVKDYSDDNSSVKTSLEFTSPYTTQYRLLFTIDKQVREYINRSDAFEFDLNYTVGDNESYDVFFNWSGLALVMDQIDVNYGVKGGFFWFMIETKNPIQQGHHIVLDPWFGSKYYLGNSVSLLDTIRGTAFKITEYGIPQNIELYTKCAFPPNQCTRFYVTCAIYNCSIRVEGSPPHDITYYEPHTKLVESNVWSHGKCISGDMILIEEGVVATCNFSDDIVLEKDEYYVLCVTSNTSIKMYKHGTLLDPKSFVNSTSNMSFPDILEGFTNKNWIHSIWSNYEKLIDITDPIPADESTNVSISPTLNINVSHYNGENMNITWYSNSSGSWVAFGTNSSVGNGTYSQVFSNASVNGAWWYWKVCVDDGTFSVWSDVYRFYTGVQSKLVNSGSTNISGFLLMQVQYSDPCGQPGEWVVDCEVVNETTSRTVLGGDVLGLDSVFNGLVSTGDLSNGNGTYRVYAAFCSSGGSVLVTDDEVVLACWYEFEVTLT